MSNIEFAWDSRKARTNLARHRISFEEAQSVFVDENARLVVIHSYRESDAVIRIISARRATKQEQEMYWSFQ